MISFFIALAAGAAVGYLSFIRWDLAWGITCGVITAAAVLPLLGLLLRKKISARQQEIQTIMQNAQNKVNRQIALFQRRPTGQNEARQSIEKIQLEAVREALAVTEKFRPFYKWNFLLERQINTLRVQLFYQLREYKKVDELLRKSLLLDPQSIAIQLARMYKNSDPRLDKFFRSKSRRLKGDNAAFVASVYAWIKLRDEQTAPALEALRSATKTSDNPSLAENIDRLVNGKTKHFTNSGFGDLWYSLALEEPKMKTQRAPQYGRPF